METILPILWLLLKILGWCILGILAFMGFCMLIILLFPISSWDAMMRSDDEEIENKHYE